MYAEVASLTRLASVAALVGATFAGLLANTACAPSYPSIDDACRESPPSPRGASQVTSAAAARLNCHRRFLGLRELRIQEQLQTAAQSHADYLVTHGPVEGGDLHAEDAELDGSLGATLSERLQSTGIDVSFAGQNRPIEVVFGATAEQASDELVDRMMRDPESSALLLAPGATGVGFGRADDVITAVLLAGTPSNEAVTEAILWPASGQLEVPRRAARGWSSFEVPELPEDIVSNPFAVPGHAITVLVGGTTVAGSIEGSNYGLSVDPDTVVFASPDAELPVLLLGPGYFGDDTDAVHVLPLSPLAPSTTYTLELDASWGSPESTQSISMWFRTAEE